MPARNESLLQRFHSVTMESTFFWDAQSTQINEQRPFDDVASRKYYVGMLQLGTTVKVCVLCGFLNVLWSYTKGGYVSNNAASQLSENWILSEKILPQSVTIWQKLPIGNLTGYSIVIRVRLTSLRRPVRSV